MGIISLEGMDFFAYHGCFTEEQIIGTHFIVDLHLETDTSQAETKARGVFCFPMPMTSLPLSRMRVAKRV